MFSNLLFLTVPIDSLKTDMVRIPDLNIFFNVSSLWEICNGEHSHICEVCVPLLLHCVTLPTGSDVFWSVIQEEFHSPDWRVRFVAGNYENLS